MKCRQCDGPCKKAGQQPNGKQKYKCKLCGNYRQADYSYNAYKGGTDKQIVTHVKEGCGIWNIARLLHISKTTVLARIKRIAVGIKPEAVVDAGGTYEVDELHTFIGNKQAECYVSFALCRITEAGSKLRDWGKDQAKLGTTDNQAACIESAKNSH
jgi:transposase-like protein